MSQSNEDFAHRFWTAADGLTLHAADYAAASGPALLPVICLHGLTRNARDFDMLAPWLAARRRRVLAVDVRGRGLSEWDPQARYVPEVYADDIVRMAAALGIARAHFIGTSMGGLITMEVAGSHLDLVASAVLNDIGPELSPVGIKRITGYAGKSPTVSNWDEAEEHLRKLNSHAHPQFGPGDWLRMARRMFREEAGRIIPHYDPDIAKPLNGGSGALPADPWQRWNALAAARPVLLLRGALSDLLDPAVAARMAGDHVNVALRTVADVGHAPMLGEPDAIAAIAEHFDSLD